MAGGEVALFGRRAPEILKQEHADGAGASATVTGRFHPAYDAVQILGLAIADLQQRVPKLRLKPHAGAATLGHDIPIDQTTAHGGGSQIVPEHRGPHRA